MTSQYCSKCAQYLSPDAFAPSARGKHGAYCRGCQKAYKAARRPPASPRPSCDAVDCAVTPRDGRYCARHRSMLATHGTTDWRRPSSGKACGHGDYVRGCSDCRSQSRAQQRAFRSRNPERAREIRNSSARRRREHNSQQNAAWRRANPEKVRQIRRDWWARNPDRCRDASQSYYERNRDAILSRARARQAEDREPARRAARHWAATRRAATMAQAINEGLPWSTAEIRVVCDLSLSAVECAFALGRSLSAVQQKRWRLRREAAQQISAVKGVS